MLGAILLVINCWGWICGFIVDVLTLSRHFPSKLRLHKLQVIFGAWREGGSKGGVMATS